MDVIGNPDFLTIDLYQVSAEILVIHQVNPAPLGGTAHFRHEGFTKLDICQIFNLITLSGQNLATVLCWRHMHTITLW